MSPAQPQVIPMLAYEDGFAAMDWVARAFGFRERARMAGSNGLLAHGEMEVGGGLIMLAKREGATILSEPEDGFPGPALPGRRPGGSSLDVHGGSGLVIRI